MRWRDFLAIWVRIHLSRRKRRVVKEGLIGLAVGSVIALGSYFSAEWVMLAIVVYLYMTQVVAMTSNDVFFRFADLRRLGLRHPTWGYRAVYVIHYVLRDKFIATGVALPVGAVGISCTRGPGWMAFFLCVYVANLYLLPSHVYLSARIASRAKTVYLLALLIPIGVTAMLLAMGLSLPLGSLAVIPTAWLGAMISYVLIIDQVAKRIRPKGREARGGRKAFAWLKTLSDFYFKDVLLFFSMVGGNMLMGLALFALIVQGAPPGLVPFCALFALAGTNLFLSRKNKRYRLVAEDTLFSELALPRDKMKLRRSKLRTLSSSILIQAVLYGVVVAAVDGFDPNWGPLVIAALICGLMLDAPLLYLDETVARWLRHFLKYIAIFAFLAVTFFDQSALVAWSVYAAIGVVYLPSVVSVFAHPRRPSAGFNLRTRSRDSLRAELIARERKQ
jgi:hypothetical protein